MSDPNRDGVTLGVLIIGSLYWDCDPQGKRRTWRNERVKLDGRQHVRAPIRYGRLSKSREDSYTMVFSPGLCASQYGRAIVVPCSRPVKRAADLEDEAEQLWTAESLQGGTGVSASWGCVALLPNPRRPMPANLRDAWTDRVAGKPGYGQLASVKGESLVVDEAGLLRIPWPEVEDGAELEVDALLSAVTSPTNGSYPAAQKVADAQRESPRGAEYFRENRKHGIETFQDAKIEAALRASQRVAGD